MLLQWRDGTGVQWPVTTVILLDFQRLDVPQFCVVIGGAREHHEALRVECNEVDALLVSVDGANSGTALMHKHKPRHREGQAHGCGWECESGGGWESLEAQRKLRTHHGINQAEVRAIGSQDEPVVLDPLSL